MNNLREKLKAKLDAKKPKDIEPDQDSKVLAERNIAIAILAGSSFTDEILQVLTETTDPKVFEYALHNLDVKTNLKSWDTMLKRIQGSLIPAAVEKYSKETNSIGILGVVHNPEISDFDLENIIREAEITKDGLAHIIGKFPSTVSTRVSLKLAMVPNVDKIIDDMFAGYRGYSGVSFRLFCINQNLVDGNVSEEFTNYVEKFAERDVSRWISWAKPSATDVLLVLATLFSCVSLLKTDLPRNLHLVLQDYFRLK